MTAATQQVPNACYHNLLSKSLDIFYWISKQIQIWGKHVGIECSTALNMTRHTLLVQFTTKITYSIFYWFSIFVEIYPQSRLTTEGLTLNQFALILKV